MPAFQPLHRNRFCLVPLGSQREFWYKYSVHIWTTMSPSTLNFVLYIGTDYSELMCLHYERRQFPLKLHHQSKRKELYGIFA